MIWTGKKKPDKMKPFLDYYGKISGGALCLARIREFYDVNQP